MWKLFSLPVEKSHTIRSKLSFITPFFYFNVLTFRGNKLKQMLADFISI